MRATSVSSTFTLVSSTLMSAIVSSVAASLFNVPWIAVSPFSTLRRVTRPDIGAKIVVLPSELLRIAERRGGLVDRVLRRLVQRLVDVDRRAQLLDLLVGDELRVGLLDRRRALVALLRLDQVRLGLRHLRAARRERRPRTRCTAASCLLRIDLEQELALA